MSLLRGLPLIMLGAIIAGAIVSASLTHAWVDENLSGDFIDQASGKLDVGLTTAIFLLWTLIVAAPVAFIGAGIAELLRERKTPQV